MSPTFTFSFFLPYVFDDEIFIKSACHRERENGDIEKYLTYLFFTFTFFSPFHDEVCVCVSTSFNSLSFFSLSFLFYRMDGWLLAEMEFF